jgi:hypothetical protein
MTATIYDVPDNPTDPEGAALELIVRLPVTILHRDDFVPVLQEFCSLLHAEGCFAGLSWSDAKNIAAAVAFDAVMRDDAVAFIAQRARNVLGGDGLMWDDQQGAARALNIAARVLAL